MKTTTKLLATVGFLGLAASILAFVFNLYSLVTPGLAVFFACVVGVITYTAIKGYNPADR